MKSNHNSKNKKEVKCTGCQKTKEIVSSDSYGQYCRKCTDINWDMDNGYSQSSSYY